MYDEVPEWDDLEVRVVVEYAGQELIGVARGTVARQSRLEIIARAAVEAAVLAGVEGIGTDVGVATTTVAGVSIVNVVVPVGAESLVGSAPIRHFEEEGQAAIRAVFDAVNRLLDRSER
jgi:hypothetical protein